MIKKITQKSYFICMVSFFSLCAGELGIKEQKEILEKITSKLTEIDKMEERIAYFEAFLNEIQYQQKAQPLEKMADTFNKNKKNKIEESFKKITTSPEKEKIKQNLETKIPESTSLIDL